MFIKQIVKDIIQNHKDAPDNWTLDKSYKHAINNKHKLYIELTADLNELYSCKINDHSITSDLNFFECRLLIKYFKKLLGFDLSVPTKENSPEKFI